ncbi:B1 protein-like [Anoplophora glabripennis]|uniref:B1 protein-like n=1 Tax=Anoplophora glabripennis TaxID=217634 RepID=UPI0008755A1B|nr:B1 protein-like [Anoplophora glabripennis]
MKTSVAIIVTCVIFSTAKATLDITSEQKAKLDEYKDECKKQSGVNVEILKKLPEGEFPEDPKLKEFLFCVSKKTGFQNDAGEIQQAVIIEKLGKALKDPAKAKELTEKCTNQEGSPSEITYKFVICFYNHSSKHVVIV